MITTQTGDLPHLVSRWPGLRFLTMNWLDFQDDWRVQNRGMPDFHGFTIAMSFCRGFSALMAVGLLTLTLYGKDNITFFINVL